MKEEHKSVQLCLNWGGNSFFLGVTAPVQTVTFLKFNVVVPLFLLDNQSLIVKGVLRPLTLGIMGNNHLRAKVKFIYFFLRKVWL